MSNRIAITVYVDIPEGLTPDVTYGNTPPVVQATLQALSDEPPFPTEELPRPQSIAPQIPVCRIHNKPMAFHPADTIKTGPRSGQPRGAFWSCQEKVDGKWCPSKQDAAA